MKHALITGGARRIGREIVIFLAQNGWDITVHYAHSNGAAKQLAQEVESLGRKATLVKADFKKNHDLAALLPKETDHPVTALIHNASLFVHDEDDPDGSRHRTVNYDVPLKLSEKFAAQLPVDHMGAIVHFLDNTKMPDFLQGYLGSRIKLSENLLQQACMYAPKICVNAVALGPTMRNERQSEAHFNALVDQTPLKRPTDPLDVACVVHLLIETKSVTGQILNVDSGMHMGIFN